MRDRLVELMEGWCAAHPSAFPNPAQRHIEAVKAATWATLCCWSDASLSEHIAPARFLLMFFVLDDAPRAEQEQFLEALKQGHARPDSSAALWELYEGLFHGLDVFDVSSVGRVRLHESMIEMCEGMLDERCANNSLIDEEQLFAMRRRSIAVDPYLLVWLVAKKVELSSVDDVEIDRMEELRRLAIDLIILAQDLASVEKDRAHALVDPVGVDPNLVLVRARQTESLESAIDEVVKRYNHQIDLFKTRERELKDSSSVSQTGLGYIGLLKNNIDGNAEGHRRLAEIRYPGARQYLSMIHPVCAASEGD